MSLVLSTAWHPRGEFSRFERLLPQLGEVYPDIVISLPPQVSPELLAALNALNGTPRITPVVTREWVSGRHVAFLHALKTSATHIHYVDFDRLLRWVETRPAEWRRAAAAVEQSDCLVIGRTPAAYDTHPQALTVTERLRAYPNNPLARKAMSAQAKCRKAM